MNLFPLLFAVDIYFRAFGVLLLLYGRRHQNFSCHLNFHLSRLVLRDKRKKFPSYEIAILRDLIRFFLSSFCFFLARSFRQTK